MSEVEVEYLSVDDLLLVAAAAVGPAFQVADLGLLASALARPQASAFGADAYPSLPKKAAALLLSLVGNHALVDGNKRIGWAATVVFCRLNGAELTPPSEDQAFDLVIAVAQRSVVDVAAVSRILAGWIPEERR